MAEEALVWWPERGYGFYPAKPQGKYNEEYWNKYVGYKNTPVGVELTTRRIAFVERHWTGPLIDVGIGCGHFVEVRGINRTRGYDVNPIAIRWLLDKNAWFDPYAEDPECVSFWDSIEHVARAADLMKRVRRCVFISIPIFHGEDHVLRSKHFRKDEHFWYFTEHGLVGWMGQLGFSVSESNRMEEELGREDIGTYAFLRTARMPEVPE